MVDIQIRERNVEVSRDLRLHVEQQVELALGRFGQRIARVVVRLSGGRAEPAGQPRCQIHVGLRSRSARVEESGIDLAAAVERATGRLSRTVTQVLEREREWNAAGSARLPRAT